MFRNFYLLKFSTLPTDTQFTERGVKSPSFLLLGRRGQREKLIGACNFSREILTKYTVIRTSENLARHSSGKVGEEKYNHSNESANQKPTKDQAVQIQRNHDGVDTAVGQKYIKRTLTNKNIQFKVERINQNVEVVKKSLQYYPSKCL